jgi:protoheme IX farnesyltransferase
VQSNRSVTAPLASAVVGVYLLVVAGATATVADAAAACGTWPLCRPDSAAAIVALGHRGVAALVGLLVLATVVLGWSQVDRRVRAMLVLALLLYPVQVAVGGVVAVSGTAGSLPGLHLGVGMAIFGALTLALAWHLEARTGTDDDPVGMPEPAPDPADGTDEAAVDESPGHDSLAERARATAWAYFRLTKPRLMWLLCLVASAAMALAGGTGLSIGTVVATLGGGVLAIGASGTFNHVLERDVDQRMSRTADRPVATHRVPVRNAVAFGLGLTLLSLVAFLQVNALAAALGFAAIVFYSVVYTLVLKPNTVQNTVIGGAAGALPALIGWAAVTGEIGLPGVLLAGVVFLWTPAHFYNLALAYKDDYERGGFPMLPVVRGETVTRKHILLYLGATLAAAGALVATTDLGVVYAGTTVAFGAGFLWAVVRLHRERSTDAAFRAFHASNAYLGALLLAVVVDALAV